MNTIRHEREEDYYKVENLAREAFWNLYLPGCHEHLVVNRMRNHKDFMPELSFVLEKDGEIVGSIFYTKSKVVGKNGEEYETVSFGPVCIAPGMHRQGLGRELITHSIEEAKKLGHRAIITLGYTYHYAPYGFVGGKKYGIGMADGHYYKGLLVLPLYEGALDGVSGHIELADVFDVTQEEVDAFDEKFPPKAKEVTPSQAVYEQESVALDI